MEREHVNLRAALAEVLDEAADAPEPSQLGLELPPPAAGPARAMVVDDHEVAAADLLGLPETAVARQAVVKLNNAGKGRPRGLRNHKTEYWINYLTRRYASPLEVLAQLANAPIDTLARELHCSRLDAVREKRHAAEALAPYLHQRLSVVELHPPGAPGMPVSLSMVAIAEGLSEIDGRTIEAGAEAWEPEASSDTGDGDSGSTANSSLPAISLDEQG
jgi:hypothetical protein